MNSRGSLNAKAQRRRAKQITTKSIPQSVDTKKISQRINVGNTHINSLTQVLSSRLCAFALNTLICSPCSPSSLW